MDTDNSHENEDVYISGQQPVHKEPHHEAVSDPKQLYFIAAVIGIFIIFLGISAYIWLQPNKAATSVPYTPTSYTPPTFSTPTGSVAVQQAATPTASPTPSLTPIPTVSNRWNFFLNQLFKFSVQYPPDWKATNLGQLEPLIPGYFTFNPRTASASSELAITLSVSTRTYNQVLALQSASRSAITVNGIKGVKTDEQNSDGVQSTHVVLPGKKYVYIFAAKKQYESVFDLLYPTFTVLP